MTDYLPYLVITLGAVVAILGLYVTFKELISMIKEDFSK